VSRWPERVPVGDPSDPRGFEVLVGRYLEWLEVHHYSPRTVTTARNQLRAFAEWCGERGLVRPGDVSRAVVERYQRWLYHYRQEDGRPLAFGTQLGRLSRVKSFYRWLARERYLLYNPASELVLPKERPRLPVDTFSVEEVERIMATPDLSTFLGLRDRAILEVLYSTGLRRSEVAHLELYDVDSERGWVVVRQGKGGKDRVVPIGERALAWLGRYLEEARPALVCHPVERALFVNTEGLRFTTDGLGNRVAKILADSGVRERPGCCHLFRHTMATLMLERGADIRYIQQILGHASLDTTEVYTRVSITKLKEIHSATHPAKLERTREAASELLERLAEEAAGEAAGE
jgi:integrase/recombinase XerD